MIKRFRLTTIPALYIFNCVNTYNAKKMGRNRRGTLVLKKVEWTVGHFGNEKFYDITLEWYRPKMKWGYVSHNGLTIARIAFLSYTDHNKLLKVIKKYER